MPRKGRRELVGDGEDEERREREELYAEMEIELHAERGVSGESLKSGEE